MAKKQNTSKGGEDLRELIVILSNQGAPSKSRAVSSSLDKVLEKHGVALTPLFGPASRLVPPSGVVSEAVMGVTDQMSSFYTVETKADKDALLKELAKDAAVEAAYIKPAPEPPVYLEEGANERSFDVSELPTVTPDFTSRQIYLNAAPAGIDALYAHNLAGGKGDGIRIIDIEGAWQFTHEDLIANQGGVIGGTPSTDIGWRNHGTAVSGEFGGDENGKGILGICPNAFARAISIFGGMGSANAIKNAANALSAGDIILIELHRAGPRFNFAARDDQRGYIAIEWWPDDFAAIKYATAKGVIVVEAAGNGAENLDDALYNTRPTGFPTTWTNPFKVTNPQSGAIIVGAGAPPPGTHGRNHGADRSRLDFSNYGARVDVQGWGREVTTCGYGGLQGGSGTGIGENFWYTDTFSGTSSASPIVVGALGCIQGRLKNRSKTLLTPATAKNLLRTTGSPQQNEPGRPATQRIGNRPDLKAALTSLGVGKALIKEVKDKEVKEFKEGKEIIKEVKEKDIKEFKEVKELKEKEVKEFKEKDKDIIEHHKLSEVIVDKIRPTSTEDTSTEDRLAQLEDAVVKLQHYIGSSQRPDLLNPLFENE